MVRNYDSLQPIKLTPQEQIAQLRPFFPPHLMETAAVQRGNLPLGAPELFDGTLVIADLKNFSAQSAQLFRPDRKGDAALLTLANSFFDVVLAEARRFSGSPFSFDGDAVSILFRGPRCAADLAITAAFAIQEAVSRAVVHMPSGDMHIQASFGLSSGQFLAASFGEKNALVYTLLGQPATQAVGAQKAAVVPRVIVTESTISASTFQIAAHRVSNGFYAIDVHKGQFAEYEASSALQPEEQNTLVTADVAIYLASHFPPRVVNQLLSTSIWPDSRYIAVLFVNVDGLGKMISANSLRAAPDLDYFFGGVRRIVDEHGGLFNKVNSYYIGDKYLAFWGVSELPCADPGSAALHAAFELQAWVAKMPFALKQRIGLSAGQASECIVGNEWRREFTVMGQPVNEAVHLMELADWGEIVGVGDLRQSVQLDGWSVSLKQVSLKGYSHETTISRFSRERKQGHS